MQERIIHFGVSILKKPTNYLSRENYAVIDKNSSTWSPRIGKLRKAFYKSVESRKKVYDDEDCKIYSDAWCEKHRQQCLQNYDLNMIFFAKLDKDDFEKNLNNLVNKSRTIKEVKNLNDYKGITGIYILVLDEYKQIYVGQTYDIKKRVMAHWSKTKQFDRLIFGSVESSVLSIDSFGALDTTRIYAVETTELDSAEKRILKKIPDMYKLNRIGGGRPTCSFEAVEVLANMNVRNLNDLNDK